MARPKKHDTGPVLYAETPDGDKASWCDGAYVPADAPIVKNALAAAERGQEYRLMGGWVKCDSSTVLGAMAALGQMSPGRTFFTISGGKWPDEVLEALAFPESGLSFEDPEAADV
ncbi:hypothetical protein [Arthrobacter sp. 162MFSha1.1]|uniref:hypothetical protein n=1 Tax=Arthrobacter sp. 162MFSha1.1 TaxID=1151119 RepID=UPI000360B8DC|nr:hypothetical protein [Arthrobacter sp. 162MFSha1.1]